jgi:hypothetical protein
MLQLVGDSKVIIHWFNNDNNLQALDAENSNGEQEISTIKSTTYLYRFQQYETSVAWQRSPCQVGTGVNAWVASCSTCGIHAEFSIPELVLFEISKKLLMSGTSTKVPSI